MKYGYLFLALFLSLALHDYLLVKKFQSLMRNRINLCFQKSVEDFKKERPHSNDETVARYSGALIADCINDDSKYIFYGIDVQK